MIRIVSHIRANGFISGSLVFKSIASCDSLRRIPCSPSQSLAFRSISASSSSSKETKSRAPRKRSKSKLKEESIPEPPPNLPSPPHPSSVSSESQPLNHFPSTSESAAIFTSSPLLDPLDTHRDDDANADTSHSSESIDSIVQQSFSSGTPSEDLLHYREQSLLEIGAIDVATADYRAIVEETNTLRIGASLKPAQRIIKRWYTPMAAALKAEMHKMKQIPLDKLEKWQSALLAVSPEKLPVITLHQSMGMILPASDGVSFGQIALTVGRAVLGELNLERIKNENEEEFKWMLKSRGSKSKSSTNINVASINMKAKYVLHDAVWDSSTAVKIGAFLVDQLVKTATIELFEVSKPSTVLTPSSTSNSNTTTATATTAAATPLSEKVKISEPAFFHTYRQYHHPGGGIKRQGTIKCNENVFKAIEWGHLLRETVHARLMPMVVPPMPWTNPNSGGYLYVPTFIMRTHGSAMQVNALWNADLTNIYQGLNVLGETPWRINERMYHIIDDAYARGDNTSGLPDRKNIPPPEKTFDPTDVKAQRAHQRMERKVKQLNADLHGLRCTFKLQMEVARKCIGKQIFFPHNIDFRGRAYPIPPHLNQMGSDMSRGLLLFDDAKPLGPRGLRWMKIHLANLYGVDKVPFEDRVSFVDRNMASIIESAENPLDGSGWWKKADEPFQCLATCMELVDAVRSSNPEEHVTRLPIHQDGTCNGLQHYAALGGDELGARKVNVLPSSHPQDVYSGVATLVAKRVAQDAEDGHELAVLLNGKINRKIVKQTVMTSVYGVTFVGARLQIENALSEQAPDLTEEQLWSCSSYLAKQTFASLNQIFLGARGIMEWLAKCAKVIAKAQEPVVWVTPLGLPVVQPYRKVGKLQVRTVVQTVVLTDVREDLPVSTTRQRSAFPPNFIHSLDSTHMFLTAIECAKQGITYASVHDSYWTHPSTVDEMGVILRKQFVELHSQPLLERLREWFNAKYPQLDFPPLPVRGELDLTQVEHSNYFFH